jgi:glycosyltransferase involved in cell wall biosynthesis
MSKIVYIANSTIPSRTANSIHVMKMCEALAGAGNEVELNYPIRGLDLEAGASDIFKHYGVSSSFSLHLLERPATRGARYYFAIRAALRARWRGVRLAFCRNHWAAYFCALIGIPTLFEAHTPVAEDDPTGLKLFRRLIRCSHFRQLIVITQALRDHYVSRFPELDGRVAVLPDAASPLPEGVGTEQHVTNTGTFNVGYVGQLYRGKGMELIAQLAPLCPEMTFHVVGGLEADLGYWTRACAGQGNIVFHGYVAHARVPGFIMGMDAVLLPNQSFVSAHGSGQRNISEWTSPLKAFEYMAAGKAIVASDLPALREVLRDGENALLCPPDAPDQWRAALLRLAADPGLRAHLAGAGQSDFVAKYSWSARARKALEIAG